MEVTNANGGNAEVAHTKSNLQGVVETNLKIGVTLDQGKLKGNKKMDGEEVNSGDKSVKKKPMKRKMRKSKSNSTSSVETNAKQKARGVKRKLSDPCSSNDEESQEFLGFSPESVNLIETELQVIQKLIADAELETNSSKRKRSSSKATPTNLESKSIVEHAEKVTITDGKTNSINVDEGLKQEDEKETEKKDAIVIPHASKSVSNNVNSETPSSEIPSVNASNNLYKEPFKFGWRREVIYKGESNSAQKRIADIYYYSPKGKKVESLREVAECLTTKELTLDNFTFSKESIGVEDPSLEMITDTKKPRLESTNIQATPTKKSSNKRAPMAKALLTSPPGSPKIAKTSPPKATTPARFKIKVPGKRAMQKKEVKPSKESEMVPPQWASPTATRRSQTVADKLTSPKNKRILKKKNPPVEADTKQHFMVSVCAGYHALSRIFQYLTVQELLRAARVCRMWRDLAAHPALWKTVRMKNSPVTDWVGLAASLKRHGTQHLDLRKMLIADEPDTVWEQFVSVLPTVPSLTSIKLCKCPSSVVEGIFTSCPQLEILSAMGIKNDVINIESLGTLKHLKEVRLKSINGMTIHKELLPLEDLKHLTQLNLTSVKELGKKNIEVLGTLHNLQSLELGECFDFPDKFGTDVLLKLTNLEKLRLEKGQGTCCTFQMLEGVSKLKKLHQLELVNFDLKTGFDKCLASCKNIKRLLIIPTYVSQSATSNNMVLSGVSELHNNLTHFVWGVTHELLRVTDLFVDQGNQMNRQASGDSIPVLKPVPCLKLIEDTKEEQDDKQSTLTNSQVEILSLLQVQKLLLTALPKTRVKILKIPFHTTWSQSISDTTSQ